MTHDDLTAKSAELLSRLANDTDDARKAALPELEKHLSDLRVAGLSEPIGLKDLVQDIHDLALEDDFDNMPL